MIPINWEQYVYICKWHMSAVELYLSADRQHLSARGRQGVLNLHSLPVTSLTLIVYQRGWHCGGRVEIMARRHVLAEAEEGTSSREEAHIS